MTVDSERIAAVVLGLSGRTVCPECAEVFVEILDAVRRSSVVPQQRDALDDHVVT